MFDVGFQLFQELTCPQKPLHLGGALQGLNPKELGGGDVPRMHSSEGLPVHPSLEGSRNPTDLGLNPDSEQLCDSISHLQNGWGLVKIMQLESREAPGTSPSWPVPPPHAGLAPGWGLSTLQDVGQWAGL